MCVSFLPESNFRLQITVSQHRYMYVCYVYMCAFLYVYFPLNEMLFRVIGKAGTY